jgi:hypothetical protein
MINKLYSSNLARTVVIAALAIPLLLDGLAPVSAPAAMGGAIRSKSTYSSQINIPPGLTNITADAASASGNQVIWSDGPQSSLGDDLSGQTNVSNFLASGRIKRHRRKLTA